MDKATVHPAHPQIHKGAAQACRQHDETTLLEATGTRIMRYQYNESEIHKAIYQDFRDHHGKATVRDLTKHYQVEPTVSHKNPFILFPEGKIPTQANETLIIIPLGYLQTYPSTPKLATGSTIADLDGYYEPVILTSSILDGQWSILPWKSGTYIRIPPKSILKVQAGIVFSLMVSINFE
ncbi:hypothetical protein AUP68_06427 [Ilyonectria robusta]